MNLIIAGMRLRSLVFRFLKSLLSRKFSSVKWITTNELAQWLADPAKPQPLVLDARTEAEYGVSHLQTARRIDPAQPDLAGNALSADTPIVIYCSVGYRSARIVQQLEQAGFTHAYNLEGSIFQWANEGRPLYAGDRPTSLVHPYNSRWGKLLKSQYRANKSK